MKKLGQFELGKVHCVDCIEAMKLLPDGCVDAMITDPPYGVGLTARVTKHSTRRATSTYADDAQTWLREILPRVSAWIKFAGRSMLTPGTRMLQEYPRATEIGCVFQPNGAGRSRWGFTCMHPVLYFGKDPLKGGHPNSVKATHWRSESVDHPCPKPVGFMVWMVLRASLYGEVVADPFAGSGTTGVACVQTGRQFVGFEIDPEYCRIANERIAAAHKGVSLSEHKTGQDSMFGGDA